MPEPAALAWIQPPDERSRIENSRWCAAVGPVWYMPRPSTDAPADRSDVLAVVSWNVHVGGGDVAALIRGLRSGAFTDGARVDRFVLLLQEAYRRDGGIPAAIQAGVRVPRRIAAAERLRGADVGRLAEETGLAVLYAPSMRNGGAASAPEDRGNAIASTLPLLDPQVVELPLERQRRVAVIATLEGWTADGPSWRVRVVTAHFDTALALGHGGPFEARRRQADALVDALGPSDVPTILGGDFNTWRGDREPAIDLLRRAFPATPPLDRAPTWRGPLGAHAALDYIFARGAIRDRCACGGCPNDSARTTIRCSPLWASDTVERTRFVPPPISRLHAYLVAAGAVVAAALARWLLMPVLGTENRFLPFVFDKFRQADGSFTRQHGGLGLGLAIARHLTELHGGSIEARSEGEGRGATFIVRLPLSAD